jgi:hypothetical protein
VARQIWVVCSTALVAVLLFVACGGSGRSSAAKPTTSTVPEDVVVQASSFHNINTLTRVGDHFVGNLLGHLGATLAVARAGTGRYPVGTIIQLVPFEAMVKRRAGFNAATHDWEFFSLDVSAQGTKILTHGTINVVNRFGGNCASCHEAAQSQFDLVCGKNHGCAPLPIGDSIIAALQHSDPRPRQ